ncbi:MAG: tryptophan--tRNA ligase [Anaerolineaceae bacterium]|nr:tryptophan--tRNA ligase [Anaerolineaceae bacterium]
MTDTTKKRVLSGIQPSGNLTIGNYLGALLHWVEDQAVYDNYFCVVDLHAITVPQDPHELRQKTREVSALYIAAGLDPDTVAIFVQSHVPAHSELAWILTCLSPLGWLNRMTQFKDKAAKQQADSVSAGLLNYPTLMAADILLYQAHGVPVGDDQRQHLEFTRDLAQRFNHLYGETFVVPEALIPREGARVMGLDDPTAKMSKSAEAEGHAVYLLDPPNVVKKKIMRATTDSGREIAFSKDPEKAGVNNLLTIYQALTHGTEAAIEAQFEGKGYGDLKKAVVEVVNEALTPLQQRYNELMDEEGYLEQVLATGAERAATLAEKTLKDVKDRVGFLAPAHRWPVNGSR